MAKDHDAAIRVMYAALVMGILGDCLFRAVPLGLNTSIWIVALAGIAAWLVLEHGSSRSPALPWLGAVAVLFAIAMAWRDSAVLKAVCLAGIFVDLTLAYMVFSADRSLRHASVWQLGRAALGVSLNALAGLPPLIVSDLDFKSRKTQLQSANMFAIGRGLLISVPILLVFGALLISADEAFHRLVASFVDFSFSELFTHLAIVVLFGWGVAGYLRGFLSGKPLPGNKASERPAKRLGIIDIGLPLALLDVLFLSFVIIQFKYFFGGHSHVQATTGLVYSEYARRGFFELVTVAALVLPLLLICHTLLDKSDPDHEFAFRLLAGVQVLLLFVIMLSAFQRMRLYQQEYGMTELRFYTVAFMGWLAAVFVCFGFTVLRGRSEGFAFMSLIAALAIAAALLVANPDALIVRTNAARAEAGHNEAGHHFDVEYNSSLSVDAIPALISALPRLKQPERGRIANVLLLQSESLANDDWRSWSLSRRNARLAIESVKPDLDRWAGELDDKR